VCAGDESGQKGDKEPIVGLDFSGNLEYNDGTP